LCTLRASTAKCTSAGYGASAEYLRVPESLISLKPSNLSFEEAAAVPQSALVALQGLRAGGLDASSGGLDARAGGIEAGKRVLIYGASGGIGSFAVQIAAALGARVTGVCGGGNVELVRSLGADEALDYTREGFALGEGRYDLILAIRGYRPMEEYARALAAKGAYVMAGGSWKQIVQSAARGPKVLASQGKRLGRFKYSPDPGDLAFMTGLIEAGKVRPVIDSRYELRDMAEAFRHFGEGHARGKVVVRVRPDEA
jgi:NADPH:quinone reductase-like Zn-dependent oxidoreductase